MFAGAVARAQGAPLVFVTSTIRTTALFVVSPLTSSLTPPGAHSAASTDEATGVGGGAVTGACVGEGLGLWLGCGLAPGLVSSLGVTEALARLAGDGDTVAESQAATRTATMAIAARDLEIGFGISKVVRGESDPAGLTRGVVLLQQPPAGQTRPALRRREDVGHRGCDRCRRRVLERADRREDVPGEEAGRDDRLVAEDVPAHEGFGV